MAATASSPLRSDRHGQPQEFRGHLFKKSAGVLKMFAKPTKRYVILKEGTFSWWQSESDAAKGATTRKGFIDLFSIKCEVSEVSGSTTKFKLLPHGGPNAGKALDFDCAGVEHGRAAWMEAIAAHMGSRQAPTSPKEIQEIASRGSDSPVLVEPLRDAAAPAEEAVGAWSAEEPVVADGHVSSQVLEEKASGPVASDTKAAAPPLVQVEATATEEPAPLKATDGQPTDDSPSAEADAVAAPVAEPKPEAKHLEEAKVVTAEVPIDEPAAESEAGLEPLANEGAAQAPTAELEAAEVQPSEEKTATVEGEPGLAEELSANAAASPIVELEAQDEALVKEIGAEASNLEPQVADGRAIDKETDDLPSAGSEAVVTPAVEPNLNVEHPEEAKAAAKEELVDAPIAELETGQEHLAGEEVSKLPIIEPKAVDMQPAEEKATAQEFSAEATASLLVAPQAHDEQSTEERVADAPEVEPQAAEAPPAEEKADDSPSSEVEAAVTPVAEPKLDDKHRGETQASIAEEPLEVPVAESETVQEHLADEDVAQSPIAEPKVAHMHPAEERATTAVVGEPGLAKELSVEHPAKESVTSGPPVEPQVVDGQPEERNAGDSPSEEPKALGTSVVEPELSAEHFQEAKVVIAQELVDVPVAEAEATQHLADEGSAQSLPIEPEAAEMQPAEEKGTIADELAKELPAESAALPLVEGKAHDEVSEQAGDGSDVEPKNVDGQAMEEKEIKLPSAELEAVAPPAVVEHPEGTKAEAVDVPVAESEAVQEHLADEESAQSPPLDPNIVEMQPVEEKVIIVAGERGALPTVEPEIHHEPSPEERVASVVVEAQAAGGPALEEKAEDSPSAKPESLVEANFATADEPIEVPVTESEAVQEHPGEEGAAHSLLAEPEAVEVRPSMEKETTSEVGEPGLAKELPTQAAASPIVEPDAQDEALVKEKAALASDVEPKVAENLPDDEPAQATVEPKAVQMQSAEEKATVPMVDEPGLAKELSTEAASSPLLEPGIHDEPSVEGKEADAPIVEAPTADGPPAAEKADDSPSAEQEAVARPVADEKQFEEAKAATADEPVNVPVAESEPIQERLAEESAQSLLAEPEATKVEPSEGTATIAEVGEPQVAVPEDKDEPSVKENAADARKVEPEVADTQAIAEKGTDSMSAEPAAVVTPVDVGYLEEATAVAKEGPVHVAVAESEAIQEHPASEEAAPSPIVETKANEMHPVEEKATVAVVGAPGLAKELSLGEETHREPCAPAVEPQMADGPPAEEKADKSPSAMPEAVATPAAEPALDGEHSGEAKTSIAEELVNVPVVDETVAAQKVEVAMSLGIRRLLLDYDSTLNPGQGNAPLTQERAALLARFLSRWRGAGAELYVLTASNPEKKVAALEAAGIRHLFDDVLSSTMPKKFASKGDFIARRIKDDAWCPFGQLLADDSIEAVQSCFQDVEGEPRRGGPLAHTLRVPQHSVVGLTEEDLQLIDSLLVTRADPPATTHSYCFDHDGQHVVDRGDSAEKCMLDTLPKEALGGVLSANPPEKREAWLSGRPDLLELYRQASRLRREAPPPAAAERTAAVHPATSAPPPSAAPKSKAATAKAKFAPPQRAKQAAAARTVAPPPDPGQYAIDLSEFDQLVKRLEAAGAALPAGVHERVDPIPKDGSNEPVDTMKVDLRGIEALVARLEQAAARLPL